MSRHVSTCQQKSNNLKKCFICKKEFSRVTHLRRHLLIHSTGKAKKSKCSKHDKPPPCNGRPSMLEVINSDTSKLPSSSCHTVSDPLSPSVVATHVGHLNAVASSLPSDLSVVADEVDRQSLPVPVQFEIGSSYF